MNLSREDQKLIEIYRNKCRKVLRRWLKYIDYDQLFEESIKEELQPEFNLVPPDIKSLPLTLGIKVGLHLKESSQELWEKFRKDRFVYEELLMLSEDPEHIVGENAETSREETGTSEDLPAAA